MIVFLKHKIAVCNLYGITKMIWDYSDDEFFFQLI